MKGEAMQIELITRTRWSGQVSAALMFEGEKRPLAVEPAGSNKVVLMSERFDGRLRETTVGLVAGKRRLIVSGLGKRSEFEPERVRVAVAKLLSRGADLKVAELGLFVPKPDAIRGKFEKFLSAVVEGAILSSYRFTRYRQSKPEENLVPERLVLVFGSGAELEKAKPIIADAQRRCEAVCYVRDLVNEPSANKWPMKMADWARQLGVDNRIGVRVFDRHELERMGMGGIIAVGKGSHNPPCLVQLTYQPAGIEGNPLANKHQRAF
jgi:leucyl aminopeptidase